MAGESFKEVSSKAGRCNKKPVPIVECFAFCSGTTFFRWGGVTLGLQPQTLPEGIIPSDSLLPLRGGFKNRFGMKNRGVLRTLVGRQASQSASDLPKQAEWNIIGT